MVFHPGSKPKECNCSMPQNEWQKVWLSVCLCHSGCCVLDFYGDEVDYNLQTQKHCFVLSFNSMIRSSVNQVLNELADFYIAFINH